MNSSLNELPVCAFFPEIRRLLAQHDSLVLTAEPGAGKSTMIPLMLLEEPFAAGKKILMLEPRRVAARAVARRMASLLGESLGETVGYRTGAESVCRETTRLVVVTEAILTKMLQQDPSLESVSCVIFDEFHERSLHADLALALLLDARRQLETEQKIVVLSATVDAAAVACLLDHAPSLSVPGRMFPVRTIYAPEHPELPVEERAAFAAGNALRHFPGDVLVFLPGEAEIRRAAAFLARTIPDGTEVLPLYGNLPSAEQDKALAPHGDEVRRVILATPIAETGLTIPNVRIIVDSGWVRASRFSPATDMDILETVRISKASSEQRRGRAGRVSDGVCIRLWTEHEQGALEAYSKPEIETSGLTAFVLELLNWGVCDFENIGLSFLSPPSSPMMRAGLSFLRQIAAADAENRITEHGKELLRFPVHPRLAHALLRSAKLGLSGQAAALAALLSERDIFRNASGASLKERLDVIRGAEGGTAETLPRGMLDFGTLERVRRTARRLGSLFPEKTARNDSFHPEDAVALTVAAAFPDRIARRRQEQPPEYTLSNGLRAYLRAGDKLAEQEFLAVAETVVQGGRARIFLAAPLSLTCLRETMPDLFESGVEVSWDDSSKQVRGESTVRIGSLTLERKRSMARLSAVERHLLLFRAVRKEGLRVLEFSPRVVGFLERVRFLHANGFEQYPDFSEAALLDTLEDWLGPFAEHAASYTDLRKIDFYAALSARMEYSAFLALERLAPERVHVPSGSQIRIDYSDAGNPAVSVRLQELFGLQETPCVAGGKIPLLMDILSPAMRTVQKTRNLKSFWCESYFLVRKEMRGRYPKHDWPEDPANAIPHRGVKKPSRQ